jgi:uncharacterized protein YihD (DUF1040 family)
VRTALYDGRIILPNISGEGDDVIELKKWLDQFEGKEQGDIQKWFQEQVEVQFNQCLESASDSVGSKTALSVLQVAQKCGLYVRDMEKEVERQEREKREVLKHRLEGELKNLRNAAKSMSDVEISRTIDRLRDMAKEAGYVKGLNDVLDDLYESKEYVDGEAESRCTSSIRKRLDEAYDLLKKKRVPRVDKELKEKHSVEAEQVESFLRSWHECLDATKVEAYCNRVLHPQTRNSESYATLMKESKMGKCLLNIQDGLNNELMTGDDHDCNLRVVESLSDAFRKIGLDVNVDSNIETLRQKYTEFWRLNGDWVLIAGGSVFGITFCILIWKCHQKEGDPEGRDSDDDDADPAQVEVTRPPRP